MIRIALSVHAAEEEEADTLSLPWTASSPHRRREIIQGANEEVGVRDALVATTRANFTGN